MGPSWRKVVWSPDGTKIAYVAGANGQPPIDGRSGNAVYVRNVDGKGSVRAVYRSIYARPDPPGELDALDLDWQCLGACRTG